ncbi:IS4 family transposase [Cohnella rhizosphaerae]|uniref:IS4 family transposase n=1 Tax=Cohnella rhizosphaerae TaxID=1457232 RepID=A0A9X4L113_9BACL|nr:IS4 family transposase [Cohnella rhizosphaerae]MDG0811524.1 IS4 family transposase [Cohnella rhizosphaerae]
MNYRTMFAPILQSFIPNEEIQPLLQQANYVDTARKFTVYELFIFLAEAALGQWDGYRDGEKRMVACGLRQADHSTISKKAKEVPFSVFKQLLHLLIRKCNRSTRRRLRLPKEPLAVDSTTISAGHNRLPWAPSAKGEKSGIKLHVSLLTETGELHRVTESTGKQHDSTICSRVTDPNFILVADRAYGKHKQFDTYMEQEQRQYFVIRVRYNTFLHEPVYRDRKRPYKHTIEQDLTCQLGTKARLTRHRFRVVKLKDPQGNPVVLVTNLHRPSAEKIAEIYRQRWQIEVFFRWIKQHLNVPKLFGRTPNAVYGQLYTALIVYVLLQYVYVQGNSQVHPSARLSFAAFDRLISLAALPPEWVVYLAHHLSLP